MLRDELQLDKTQRILITGGAGFIGHHLVDHLLRNSNWQILIIDKLSYASMGLERLREIQAVGHQRVQIFETDLSQPFSPGLMKELGSLDYVIHAAAETHVDNSIRDPESFVLSNVVGTYRLLEYARSLANLKQFVYLSTDEVFGPADPNQFFNENDRYNSTNPYSATKAGAEELCMAWGNTYKTPVLVTHTMNLFGPRQHPEKYIPKIIRSIMNGQTISIHADEAKKKPGSRFYLYCEDFCNALFFLIQKRQWRREKINIVGSEEIDNLRLANLVEKIMDRPAQWELVDFHSSRPGHDLRYALCSQKLESMGWRHNNKFEESLEKTVRWTLANQKWLHL